MNCKSFSQNVCSSLEYLSESSAITIVGVKHFPFSSSCLTCSPLLVPRKYSIHAKLSSTNLEVVELILNPLKSFHFRMRSKHTFRHLYFFICQFLYCLVIRANIIFFLHNFQGLNSCSFNLNGSCVFYLITNITRSEERRVGK